VNALGAWVQEYLSDVIIALAAGIAVSRRCGLVVAASKGMVVAPGCYGAARLCAQSRRAVCGCVQDFRY
jgi:hypothetical protein